MADKVAMIPLSDGSSIPQVGFGTWKSKPVDVIPAVAHAIKTGYKHIDAAFAYGNEKEVGEGIEQGLKDANMKREELYVVSKLWNTFHRESDPPKILRKQLDDLKLDYIDLYLIHWPLSYVEEREPYPKDENGVFIFSPVVKGIMETWRGMEECVKLGLAKSIGLSNFNSEQIQRIIDEGTIKPVMLQVEVNLYFPQRKLIDFCRERNIKVTAHSPLGSVDRPWFKPGEDPVLLDEPALKAVGDKYKKSPAQVAIRWAIQRGIVVIPKSVTPSRIEENYDVFNFELSADDIKVLDGIDRNFRGCLLQWVSHHPDYPFNIEF